MKRIEEKVKDIVEVRNNVSLVNYIADPTQTVTGYHFTDITADLMSKWIKAYLRVGSGNGAGFALAGFRGVGKSHFLATFGAILGHPELRAKITDSLVASAFHSLARRGCSVAMVRRGTRATLLEELKDAIAPLLETEPASLSDSLNELLLRSCERAGDMPFVLLIDTAMDRGSRVSRDDGFLISEIADISRTLGIFVGVALDDDIAGADGANLAISRSFIIDYLDQEHLYKIVDTNIFPKKARKQAVLQEIYESYRSVIPNFRWSESRFSSLYPLHPAIMEIAPFVRLYMHEFALLSFASEAGSRILGRPANSLIAPDEVFDKAEKSLRQTEALKAAFAAYDQINEVVIAKIPVMNRLQAKLILKGLLLFSLNDEGATAAEIAASMLIFDERDPETSLRDVRSVVEMFVAAAPEGVTMQTDVNGVVRYRFKLDGKEDLKTALEDAASVVPDEAVEHVLRKLLDERFSDCVFTASRQDPEIAFCECSVEWRGGLRKGRIYWNDNPEGDGSDEPGGIDWTIVLQTSGRSIDAKQAGNADQPILWKAADFTAEEIKTVKRFYAATTSAQIRSDFEEHIAATIQTLSLNVEKIVQRAFLDESVLSIDGFEFNFTDDARTSGSLSQAFTIMLESLFEGRYPLHPYFLLPIRMKGVSNLVSELFGGAAPDLAEVQQMAEALGVPLGIVSKPDALYIPAEADALRELPLVRDILEVIGRRKDEVLQLEIVFGLLSEAPNGLVREAGYLLLAAMVSGRLLEFVTSNGDRINHRSLDLQLIWDDIVGVGAPAESAYSNERLVEWARLLTGNEKLRSINRKDDTKTVLAALDGWLDKWNAWRLAGRFDSVNDELLNTRIWRLARTSIKAFRIVAESITALRDSALSVDTCLQRVADAFADSESEYERLNADLYTLDGFISRSQLQAEIEGWLSLCEVTGDAKIDGLAIALDDAIASVSRDAGKAESIDLMPMWAEFKVEYKGHFIEEHEKLHSSNGVREKAGEIMRSDVWWEFENLSDIDLFDVSYRSRSRMLLKEIDLIECGFDTARLLDNRPVCECSFTLSGATSVNSLPQKLLETANSGLRSYYEILRANSGVLVEELKGITPDEFGISSTASESLANFLLDASEIRPLTNDELRSIRLLCERTAGRRSDWNVSPQDNVNSRQNPDTSPLLPPANDSQPGMAAS